MRKFWFSLTLLFLFPSIASAHAFGQQYTLPLPVWLYVYGGGAVIIVSFLLIGYFTALDDSGRIGSQVDLTRRKSVQFLNKSIWKNFLRLLGLVLFVVTIVAGIYGSPRSTENFAPTFFWIILLLGFTYL